MDLGVKKWPGVNYGKHPAYGREFGRPGLMRRARALKYFAPYFMSQMKDSIRSSRWKRPESDSASGSPYNTLLDDGIVGYAMSDSNLAELRSLVKGPIDDLLEGKSKIDPSKRKFRDNNSYLTLEEHTGIYELVERILVSSGLKDAASRYMGIPQKMAMVNLMAYDAQETHWQNMFDDTEVPDPPTTYWHMDSARRRTKVLIYLNEVTDKNGPFHFVKGSHRLAMGPIEYMVRTANDKSRLDKTDRDHRELFHALPGYLQKKTEIGNDLSGDDSEVKKLLDAEVKVTTADGNMILFDTDGIHRGGMVEEGERYILQVPLDNA
jgi:hypothetical protein